MSTLEKINLGDDKADNLNTLKRFYRDVWGSYTECVENDRLFFILFGNINKENRIAIVKLLNDKYSTNLRYFGKHHRQTLCNNNEFQTILDRNILENDNDENYALKKESKKIRIVSLMSKYQHWCNETKGVNFIPIMDKNVKKMLNQYDNNNDNKTYKLFKGNMDKFIEKYLGKEDGNHKVNLEGYAIEGLPKEISAYRLVDKFLWLSYKIINTNNTIPPRRN